MPGRDKFWLPAGLFFAPRLDLRLGRARASARHAGNHRSGREVGANLVTYLLGSFQLGRFLSSTKVYHEAVGALAR